ncbi:MAG: VWA domain-containing protein [Pyrinomonadaceae bacterium]
MLRLVSIASLVLFVVFASFAQSGRRATPSATPMAVASDDPTQYSESKPSSRRNRPTPDRLLRATKDAANAGSPAEPVSGSGEDEVLRIETNLINIPVSVFDRNGLYIPNLRRTDFKIFEDGIEQAIEYFGTTDKPFTVALVIDVSPSTAYRIEEIRESAKAFVDQLKSEDSVMVIDFDQNVNVRTKPTRDRSRIFKAIDKANFGNGTSLYNAVDETIRKQFGKIEGRKAVVLFTDGVDTTSRRNSYDSTLNYAEETDSLIFPIYYNTLLDARLTGINGGNIGGGGILGTIFGGGGGRITPGTAEEYALGRRYLEDLADVTGGRVFRPESTPGGLTSAFEGIAEELRRQYNLGYIPTKVGNPGQRKEIRVRVNRPNLVLRTRDSYIVGSEKPTNSSDDKL